MSLSDHTVRLYDVSDPTDPRPVGEPLTGATSIPNSVKFSPDGHCLAVAAVGGRAWIYELRDEPGSRPRTSAPGWASTVARDGHGHAPAGTGGGPGRRRQSCRRAKASSTSVGMRPREDTAYPCSVAQVRISAGVGAVAVGRGAACSTCPASAAWVRAAARKR